MIPAPAALRHHVEGDTLIAAATNAVWDVLSDFHGVDTWARPVTSVRPIGAVVRGLGAARHCEIERVGGIDEVVTLWEEGRQLGYDVAAFGPIAGAKSVWLIERGDSGSARVTLRLEYDMRYGWAGRVLNAFVARRTIARQLCGTLAALKRRVETGRTVRPGRVMPD